MIIDMTPTGVAFAAFPCAQGALSFGAAATDRTPCGH